VWRLEFARRGTRGGGPRGGRYREALQPRVDHGAAAVRRHRYDGRRAIDDRHRRIRSRAWRRRRAGIARADWWGTRYREVDTASAGSRALRPDVRSGVVQLG